MKKCSGRPCLIKANKARSQRRLGTTLVEVLVVIVVFLVGILAVIQIFPKGFQLLLLTRNKSVASQLARDQMEQLAARPEQLPEAIVSAHYSNGNLIIDASKDPSDLGPVGSSLAADGSVSDSGGNVLGNWQLNSGSNNFRRIIGEGRRVPAPSAVGAPGGGNTYLGGLMVLQFGPINYVPASSSAVSNLSVYGNDLEQSFGNPQTQDLRSDYQYFVGSPNNSAIFLRLPSGPNPRSFRVSFSAYITNGPSSIVKRDYTELALVIVPAQVLDSSGQYPLVSVAIVGAGNLVTDPVQSVDLNTLRVQRSYEMIAKSATFDLNEPYQYKLLNENLGILLFNPIAHEVYVSRNGHDREPLQAKVNYDVYDWRVLRDDFRIDTGIVPGVSGDTSSPQLMSSEHKLAVSSLKVTTNAGPDGLPNPPITPLEVARVDGTTDTAGANDPLATDFVLVDLATGGVYYEYNPLFPTQKLIRVDKSTGVVSIEDKDGTNSNGITGVLLLPDGSVTDVQMDNRAVRALYMARQEYSVQVLKAASQYTVAPTAANLSSGQFYMGGTVSGIGQPWRIYFPQSDNGRKVTIGEVGYRSTADNFRHSLVGQDFIIKNRPDPTLSLPSIDLTDVDSAATSIDFNNGIGARNIKGASVAVKVLWNPDSFTLTNDPLVNMSHLEQWGRGWRKTTNETYLQRGENIR